MPVQPGDIYRALAPGGPRIRVVGKPVSTWGLYGYGKVDIETVLPDGRGIRRRSIGLAQLHDTPTTRAGARRRTGYVREAGPDEQHGRP